MKNLNGWQRIWIVISILYLIPIVLITSSYLPSSNQIYLKWERENQRFAFDRGYELPRIDLFEEHDMYVKTNEQTHIHNIKSIEAKVLENKKLFTPKLVTSLEEDKKDIGNIGLKYTEELNNLTRAKIKIILIGLFFWLIPILILYVVGWSIGWIYRGFIGK